MVFVWRENVIARLTLPASLSDTFLQRRMS